jgi:GTPase SAR1 family protein
MMVGKWGAGKSSILLRYTQNKFSSNMISTTGIDYLDKKVVHKNKTIRL